MIETRQGKLWLGWIGGSLLSFLGLEVIGYQKYGSAGTLSDNIRGWSNTHPLVPFVLGVTIGALSWHFWSSYYYYD